ncbi:glucosaminidase domain-containing protein [Anaerorhabdus sp.]|jgi:hypothetical protein|uniref:glucosaminidase domain-containing protein n=1 Tax=Anaerorhabdus sp. TaxID=1872524 RepID=UPI002FC70899
MFKKYWRLYAGILAISCVLPTSALALEKPLNMNSNVNPSSFNLETLNVMELREDVVEQFVKLMDEHAIAVNVAKREGLASTLTGAMENQEALFYDKAIELGLDPVFVVALANHETGAGSSYICINKHNFGGMRGGDGWMSFASREAGIDAFLNLLVSYSEKGLSTPETMVVRYAANSPAWVGAIRKGMWKIQGSIDQKVAEVNSYYQLQYDELAKELRIY